MNVIALGLSLVVGIALLIGIYLGVRDYKQDQEDPDYWPDE